MDTLMQADIFFFVTTIAVGLLTIGLIIALVYVIKILATVKHITSTVRTESDYMAQEFQILRTKLRHRTPGIVAVFSMVRRIIQHYYR